LRKPALGKMPLQKLQRVLGDRLGAASADRDAGWLV
jgi:hypothetical protein